MTVPVPRSYWEKFLCLSGHHLILNLLPINGILTCNWHWTVYPFPLVFSTLCGWTGWSWQRSPGDHNFHLCAEQLLFLLGLKTEWNSRIPEEGEKQSERNSVEMNMVMLMQCCWHEKTNSLVFLMSKLNLMLCLNQLPNKLAYSPSLPPYVSVIHSKHNYLFN